MAIIPKPSRDRTEADHCADWQILGGVHDMVEAVRFDVKDEIELLRLLIRQRAVDQQAARVDQQVYPPIMPGGFRRPRPKLPRHQAG